MGKQGLGPMTSRDGGPGMEPGWPAELMASDDPRTPTSLLCVWSPVPQSGAE